SASVEQRCIGVEIGRSRTQCQPEPSREREDIGMIGVDELSAALACLTVAEVVAEHSPTNTIASLQHHDLDTALHQHVGASQTGDATADDRHLGLPDGHETLTSSRLVQLRTAWVARR